LAQLASTVTVIVEDVLDDTDSLTIEVLKMRAWAGEEKSTRDDLDLLHHDTSVALTVCGLCSCGLF
jgi:hypothetical protein